jgi:low affinity Fe/Cu permease
MPPLPGVARSICPNGGSRRPFRLGKARRSHFGTICSDAHSVQWDKLEKSVPRPPERPACVSHLFGRIASATSQATGRASAFLAAAAIVVIWAVTGPIFHYSDTWQLVINTGTTIVTFLMVFLIQNSQNRDSAAIQVKLDELIRVSAAHNSFIGIEHLTDDELGEIRYKC